MKKKQIHYRSPVRGFDDNLINEPDCVYFGFVERVPLAELSARSNEITAKMESMQVPCNIDGIKYYPENDRPVERYEVFPADSTDIYVMIRVPFRAEDVSSTDMNLN